MLRILLKMLHDVQVYWSCVLHGTWNWKKKHIIVHYSQHNKSKTICKLDCIVKAKRFILYEMEDQSKHATLPFEDLNQPAFQSNQLEARSFKMGLKFNFTT